jgi:outer membrane protein assembly factor BamB
MGFFNKWIYFGSEDGFFYAIKDENGELGEINRSEFAKNNKNNANIKNK